MKQGTDNHPKVRRLKRLLDVPKYVAIGILESLWMAAAAYADEGNIGKFSNEDIADYLEWDSDPDKLVAALIESGWIDECEEDRLVIHDWMDHAPDYIKDRIRKRGARQVKQNRKAKTPPVANETEHIPEVSESVREIPEVSESVPSITKPSPALSNPVQPNQTQPGQANSASENFAPPPPAAEVIDAWNALAKLHPGEIDPVLQPTPERMVALRDRLKNPKWLWREALARLPTRTRSGWRPTFDWLVANDTNAAKLAEGQLDDRKPEVVKGARF